MPEEFQGRTLAELESESAGMKARDQEYRENREFTEPAERKFILSSREVVQRLINWLEQL
jgi:hypothetical protein